MLGVAILLERVDALGVEIELGISPETLFEANVISLASSSSKPIAIKSTFTFKTSMSTSFYLSLDYGKI